MKKNHAIVWACKHFRPYLNGRKFTICTDHRPLIWLFNLRERNSKLVCWKLKLQEFDFKITYKKCKLNINVDCLSRVIVNAIESESTFNYSGDVDQAISQYINDFSEIPNTNEFESLDKIIPSITESNPQAQKHLNKYNLRHLY